MKIYPIRIRDVENMVENYHRDECVRMYTNKGIIRLSTPSDDTGVEYVNDECDADNALGTGAVEHSTVNLNVNQPDGGVST